jgi:hypothetical protein
MSANLIALLHAAVEPPGLPPLAPSEPVPGDVGEDPSAAQADSTPVESAEAEQTQTDLSDTETAGAGLAQENPTAMAEEAALLPDTQVPSRDPDLWLYRDRTVALLRRYLRLSIEVGRMPSLLGREFFRTRVTSYKASTFEDSVIFVHDVERSLEELNEFEKKLIAKIVLQQYSKEEAGRLLGCGYRTVERLFPETLDRVSKILLRREILTGLPNTKREVPKTCQEGKRGHFLAND